MDNTIFGRYSPRDTFVHKVDSRSKILLLILLMVTIFLKFDNWSTNLIFSCFYLLLPILFMIISKVSLISLFSSLKSMWVLVIFLLIIYLFIPNPSYTHQIGNTIFYYDAIYQCGYILLRLVLMISFTMVLTSTSKPMDLTNAFEWYISPLKVIKFPAHEIAMVLSIALRFIPTILEESQRIMKAQESRGVDYKSKGLIRKIVALTSLIIPLFYSAFERSEELSNAMEARGYDPSFKRSKYNKLRFGYRDIISVLLIGTIFAGVLVLNINYKNLDLINLIFKVKLGW